MAKHLEPHPPLFLLHSINTFLVLLLLQCAELLAGDIFWQLSPPDTGTWQTPGNWLTLSVPTAADRAFINNGGFASMDSGLVDVLEINLGTALSGTLSQTGGNLNVERFNVESIGQFDFLSGSLTVGSQFNLLGTFDVTGSSGSFIAQAVQT